MRFSPRAELFLSAVKTKTKRDQRVQISTELRRVLDGRRHDPAGEAIPPDGYVFGDEQDMLAYEQRVGRLNQAANLPPVAAPIGAPSAEGASVEAGSPLTHH